MAWMLWNNDMSICQKYQEGRFLDYVKPHASMLQKPNRIISVEIMVIKWGDNESRGLRIIHAITLQ